MVPKRRYLPGRVCPPNGFTQVNCLIAERNQHYVRTHVVLHVQQRGITCYSTVTTTRARAPNSKPMDKMDPTLEDVAYLELGMKTKTQNDCMFHNTGGDGMSLPMIRGSFRNKMFRPPWRRHGLAGAETPWSSIMKAELCMNIGQIKNLKITYGIGQICSRCKVNRLEPDKVDTFLQGDLYQVVCRWCWFPAVVSAHLTPSGDPAGKGTITASLAAIDLGHTFDIQTKVVKPEEDFFISDSWHTTCHRKTKPKTMSKGWEPEASRLCPKQERGIQHRLPALCYGATVLQQKE